MPFVSSLIAAALLGQSGDVKKFRDTKMGIEFDYPKTWNFRKERLYSVIEFPVAEGKTAEVQLLNTNFRQASADWQNIQVEINNSMKRTIERQWEETILGVPLLMTKLSYLQGDRDLVTLVGLLYTKTPEKLNFRLTTDRVVADQAEQMWRQVLNTLRTTDGNLPVAEDPTTKVEERTVIEPPTNADKVHVFAPEDPEAKQNLRGAQKTMITAIGKEMELWLPKGWTAELVEGRYNLKHDDLKGTASFAVEPGGVLQARASLGSLMNTSQSRFSTISIRKESEPSGTKAGCVLLTAERHGKEGNSDLHLMYAAGVRANNHWMLTYEVKSAEDWKRDGKLIRSLVDLFVVQAPPAPPVDQ